MSRTAPSSAHITEARFRGNKASALLLAAALLSSVLPAAAQAGGDMQEKMAALKLSVAENTQRLHQYQWLETTQLTSQYDAVNASLQQYPLLLQEITQTLGTLGSGTSSSGALVSSGPTLTSGL